MSNIPNTITILINTRIQGYQKIKYSPSMTEPKSRSSSVYFDPLVKLTSAIVKNLPLGTQFFDKLEFNDLISRTLSTSRQQKIDLIQATDAGYVDNNINILLKTLFAKNNKFYIQGMPFTIYSYEWREGDWRIDTIPRTSLSQSYSFYGRQYSRFSTTNDPEKQLEAFKKQYPPSVLNGFSTADRYSRFGNKNVPKKAEAAKAIPVAEVVTGEIPMDYVETNIPSDPLSATLLYGIGENYKTDIQKNPRRLDPLYKDVVKSGTGLRDITSTFSETTGLQLPAIIVPKGLKPFDSKGTKSENLMEKKLENDRIADKLKKLVETYKENLLTVDSIFENPNRKNEISDLIQQFMNSRQNFLKDYLISMKLLYKKLEAINEYIQRLLYFYKSLLQVKTSEIKMSDETSSFKLYLIKTLFTFDIQCYESLFYNEEIKSYQSNLKTKIQIAEQEINLYLSRQYNVRELAVTYLQYPELLSLQTIGFSIDLYNLVLLNENYESILWKSLSEKSVALLEEIRTTSFKAIKTAQEQMDIFKSTYNQSQRDALKTIIENAKALKKETPLFYESSHTKLIKTMTNKFLEIQNQILLSYDLITLFSRISVIVFAREIAYCSSQKNANMLNLQMYGKSGFETYYNLIYSDPSILSTLKKELTLSWTLSSNIPSMITKNNETLSHETDVSENIDKNCSAIQKKYMENLDLLVPQISALGLRKQCLKIMGADSDEASNIKTNFFTQLQSQYNSEATQIFRRQIQLVYRNGLIDGILPAMSQDEETSMLKEWMLFGKTTDKNSLFESICLALNSGLIDADSKTNNKYSSNGMYSTSTLRKAVADNITDTDISNWTEKRADLSRYRPDDPERIPYNFLFDEEDNFVAHDLASVRNAIQLEPSNGGKYYGNYQTIKILEKVLQVKMITIRVEKTQQNKKALSKGQRVKFSTFTGGKELFGTIIDVKSSGDDNTYNIMLANRAVIEDVARTSILQVDSIFFKVKCQDDLNRESANDFTHYVILTEMGNSEGYQVVFNMKQKLGIFSLDQLSPYIYYLIFNNCFIIQSDNNWYSLNADFNHYMEDMLEKFNQSKAQREKRRQIEIERREKTRKDTIQVGGESSEVLSVPNKNLYSTIGQRSSYGYGSYNSSSDSKLTYYIVIDLELYPGDSIPLGERSLLACQIRYEKIRKAYAEVFGIQYYPNDFSRNGSSSLKKNKLQNPYLYR